LKTCLIADDSPVIRLMARRLLEATGYHVREAADGAQALSACQEGMPDIILLDWRMPVMNGLEFLVRLRQLPGGVAPCVIFCSVESDPGMIGQALASGANEYVMKPFDREILAGKLSLAGVA
jgi:two-component system chemotaxis response regulator CheY